MAAYECGFGQQSALVASWARQQLIIQASVETSGAWIPKGITSPLRTRKGNVPEGAGCCARMSSFMKENQWMMSWKVLHNVENSGEASRAFPAGFPEPGMHPEKGFPPRMAMWGGCGALPHGGGSGRSAPGPRDRPEGWPQAMSLSPAVPGITKTTGRPLSQQRRPAGNMAMAAITGFGLPNAHPSAGARAGQPVTPPASRGLPHAALPNGCRSPPGRSTGPYRSGPAVGTRQVRVLSRPGSSVRQLS